MAQPEEARNVASCDDGVSLGDWFFPVLHRGTRLETRLNLARFQTEPEARSSAEGVPHSRRSFWQPQATFLH